MTNAEIAAVFDEIADILEFQGENPFRVRAYRNAARTVGEMAESLEHLVAQGADLTQLPGIGKDLAEKIKTLVETGRLEQLDKLRAQVPESVLQLMHIPGLGPRKAAALYKQLGITNLEQLRRACQEHRVQKLRGFGAKTEEAILRGLQVAEVASKRILWAEADQFAQEIKAHLAQVPGVEQLEVAGSYRRGKETVGDLDVLVVAEDSDPVMDRFAQYHAVAEVLLRGETKMSVRLHSGLQVDLRVVHHQSFGAALVYFTGSKQHNVVLRSRAKQRGLKINEYGVYRGSEYIAGRTEEEVYATLDLPWIPPELREARWEFDWADSGRLPKLLELKDIRGDLHMHTNATDGKATLEEMVQAAKQRGLKYIAITDHSKRVTMAGGLKAEELLAQWEQIDQLRKRFRGIHILKGVEVDILERGGLDIDDQTLAQADWVVASLHYGQNQSEDRITGRIVDALAHPAVCAIGHPTGRLLGRRERYAVDIQRVIEAAAEHGKFLELNANPLRLDLDDMHCALAREHGVLIVISTDAHSTEGLNVMRYGVLQARRGGLEARHVLNTRPWSQFEKLLWRARGGKLSTGKK